MVVLVVVVVIVVAVCGGSNTSSSVQCWNYISTLCVKKGYRNMMYKMLTLKRPSMTMTGRHLGFPVDDMFPVNIVFRSGTIFRKSHKSNVINVMIQKNITIRM